jgi:signal transduction histidine kinase
MRGSAVSPLDVRWRPRYDEVAIVLALVAIVASFLGATTFTERRMGHITSASQELSDVHLPAIVQASRMRGDLHRLDALLDLRASGDAEIDLLARLDDGRRRVSSLSLSDDEQRQWAGVQDDLDALRIHVTPVAQEESGVPRAEELPELVRHILSVGASLDAITTAETELASKARRDVESARAWTGRISYGLDVVCMLLAGLLTVQIIRIQRARRRSVEEHVNDLEVFAVRLAHDIRSPLMPALLALERLGARLNTDDPVRGVVERGLRSVHTIERTVDGLLAFAASGARPERPESCSLAGTLDAVVAEYLDAANAKSIEMAVECAEPQTRVACSAGVLASVLGNLVGNAIKFMGDSGTRRIAIRARSTAGRVRVEVEDSGPGLPEGADESIFEPYVRADWSTRGLGLGLATVQRLVTAHSGSVGVQSGRPKGCLFWVELPAAQGGKIESVNVNQNRKR